VLFRFSLLSEDEGCLERRLFESSTRDPLTGLLNRGTLGQRLDRLLGEAQRTGRPFAVMMIDLDRFKRINDLCGHPAGDAVLCKIARAITRTVRTGDLVGRYGGEEFAIIAASTTAAQATALAERVCRAIAEVRVPVQGGQAATTASVGVVSSTERDGSSGLDLLDLADQRMYSAKQIGGNRVRAW